MPIISKETWDKFTQEEKEEIREWCRDLTKNSGYDPEDFNNGFMHGRLEMLDDLFGKEQLQPQPLTYDDVARELFLNKKSWYINTEGQIHDGFPSGNACFCQNMCTSEKQAEKLLAINKLLNVCAWADMRNEFTIEISAELTEKINGIISDEELKLILSNDF